MGEERWPSAVAQLVLAPVVFSQVFQEQGWEPQFAVGQDTK